MHFSILEPRRFLSTDIFRQDEFLAGVNAYDWNSHLGQHILVRSCGDVHTPSWAYMILAARLVAIARSIRFGNEHDNVVVYREKVRKTNHAPNNISA